MSQKYPKEFIVLCKSVKAKRPRTVIEHILKHGHISTEELKNQYGYNHPPRAVRDVREQGVPIETFRVSGSDGRKIAAYKFGDIKQGTFKKRSGRTGLSKKIKEFLINKYGSKCFIYLEEMDGKDLQIDHRIPYEVSGDDSKVEDPKDFMLLSGSANRAKSWSCEHCKNWQELKNVNACKTCYWAFPENYEHIAMQQIRRLDLMWKGQEVNQFEKLRSDAISAGKTTPAFVKELIRKALQRKLR